jgi:hypothetical protein
MHHVLEQPTIIFAAGIAEVGCYALAAVNVITNHFFKDLWNSN